MNSYLRGSLPKSVPLDFGLEKNFRLIILPSTTAISLLGWIEVPLVIVCHELIIWRLTSYGSAMV